MEQTILGLPISGKLPDTSDYTVSPYAAIAVVKAIDSDGDDVYAVVMTDNMGAMEAGGLVKYADIYITSMLQKIIDVTSKSSTQE